MLQEVHLNITAGIVLKKKVKNEMMCIALIYLNTCKVTYWQLTMLSFISFSTASDQNVM